MYVNKMEVFSWKLVSFIAIFLVVVLVIMNMNLNEEASKPIETVHDTVTISDTVKVHDTIINWYEKKVEPEEDTEIEDQQEPVIF